MPHNNRVGDFDPFALPAIMRATGKTLEQVLDDLANRSGLAGLERRLATISAIIEEARREGLTRLHSRRSTCSWPRSGITWGRICCC